MKKTILVALLDFLSLATMAGDQSWIWLEKTSLPVEGKGFKDVESFFCRLPMRAKGVVRDPIWQMSHDATGLLIRFKTDAKKLALQWRVADEKKQDPLIPPAGVMGVDIYRLDSRKGWTFAGNKRYEGRKDGKPTFGEAEFTWNPDEAGIIYLPYRSHVTDFKVGIPEGCRLTAFPHADPVAKPIVHYGTSIVHGGCVSRPGLVFTSIAGRELDRDYINLGFSGNGRMEKELTPFLAEIDAALYVVDCAWNMDEKMVEKNAIPFLREMKRLKPETPILLCEGCRQTRRPLAVNIAMRKVYDGLKKENPVFWRNLHYFESKDMLPENDEVTHDFCHPNDYGAIILGPAYARRIRAVLDAEALVACGGAEGLGKDNVPERQKFVVKTAELQAEIDALAKAGGGTLVIRPGLHVSGSLFFRPGVNLKMERGAVLRGSPNPADYPQIETRIEGQTCTYYPGLINADRCDGFTISGKGVVDGDGLETWKGFWSGLEADPKHFRNKDPRLLRPRLLYVSNSRNVDVSGVTFRNARFWSTHYYRCDNACVHDCTIFSDEIEGVRGPSTDAIDIDNCRNFTVRGVYMNVSDDGVVIKGGKGAWADDYTRCPGNGPTENVLIENCTFGYQCHSCLTLGSECPAVTNVVMRNCVLGDANWLLHVKMRTDTPQHYAKVLIENCRGTCNTMLNVAAWTQYADFGGRTPAELKSFAEDVTIRDCGLVCRGNRINIARDDVAFKIQNFYVQGMSVGSPK